MNKAASVAIATAAVGAAAYMAYSKMKAQAKRELKSEFKDTCRHVDNVKSNLGEVRQDMTEMARTLKDQM